MRTEIFQ